jgi:cytochrome c
MNTMEITKIFGALCGALLIFLLIRLAGEGLYHVDRGAEAFVIEVADAEPGDDAPAEDIDFVQLIADADPAAGETVFRRCSACHVMEAGENRAGPYLHGVVGRDIAAAEGFSFSPALGGIDGVWDYEALYGFLRNPREWAPGTTMNFAGLASQAERANVIAYLEEHGGGS